MQIAHARFLRPSWFVWLSVICGMIAAAKGARPPNLWSATQAQLSYEFGFVKRGMFGQVARSIGLDIGDYQTVFVVAWIIMLAFIGALAFTCIRLRLYARLDTAIMATLMWASFAFTYVLHLIGYTDILLLTIALAIIGIPNRTAQLWCALAAAAFGVLVHESYLLLFLPLTLAPAFLDILKTTGSPFAVLRRCLPLIVTAATATVIVVIVAKAPSWTLDEVVRNFAIMRARANFPLRDDFQLVTLYSLKDNLLLVKDMWLTDAAHWRGVVLAVRLFWPTGMLVVLATALHLAHGFSGWRLVVAIAVAAAIAVLPLTMLAVGFDVARWHAIALLESFVLFGIVVAAFPTPAPKAPSLVSLLLIAAIPVNLIFDGVWLDNYHPWQGASQVWDMLTTPVAAWTLPPQ